MKPAGVNQLFKEAKAQTKPAHLFSPTYFVSDARLQAAQWHIWTDGQDVVSAILIGGQWLKGPDISYKDTHDGDTIQGIAARLVKEGFNGARAQTIGIVFHVADEFSTSAVRDSMSAPDRYREATATVLDEPGQVVDGMVEPGVAYRYFPLAGQKSAVVVRQAEERGRVFQPLIDSTSPIRIVLAVAAVEMIAAIPAFVEGEESEDANTAELIALIYSRFTVACAFGKAVSGGGRGLRVLDVWSHGGGRNGPANFPQRLRRECEKLNAVSTTLTLVQCSPGAPVDALLSEIQEDASVNGTLPFNVALMRSADVYDQVREKLPTWNLPPEDIFRPEFFSAMQGFSKLPGVDTWFGSDTNALMFAQAASANFSSEAMRVDGERITRTEAAVLVFASAMKVVLLLGVVAALIFVGMDVVNTRKSEAWNLPPDDAIEASARFQKMTMLERSLKHWKALLAPRSEPWVTMELVAQLFPENCGALVREVTYRTEAMQPPPPTGGEPVDPPKTVGFKRQWTITGIATDRGGSYLDSLSNEKIEEGIARTEAVTGRRIYQRNPTEVLSVRVDRSRQPAAVVGGRNYPVKFDVTVEQIIATKSDLALPNDSVSIPPVKETVFAP